MKSHTEGPWSVKSETRIEAAAFGMIASVRGATEDESTHANARLIAAAPDLLFALEALLEYAQDTMPEELTDDMEVWNQAKKAVEKAA